MDSGNSGSLQSSSGGDEEYDSRAAGTMFMTDLTTPQQGGPFPPQMFDPLANYMQLHQNPSPQLLNPNIHWARPDIMRSDPDSRTGSIIQQQQTVLPAFQPPASAPESMNPGGAHAAATAARNPKKRSRASRRAPTTVLTTDTTNFRAMVQEFTGIPAPPFSNSSFPRSRLDIFGTISTALDPPPYIRRPFAQKVQSPGTTPFLSSSTATNHTNSSAAASSSTNPINYQIPNTQNFQNPLLSSLLQTNPKFIFSGSSAAAKPPHRHAPFEIPSIEEFGLGGHGNHVTASLAGLPRLIPSDQIGAQNDRNANNWRSSNEGEDFQNHMKPVNGNYTFHKNPSSSNFHGGVKGPGPENIAARGEGTPVESWICSSE